MAPKSRPKRKRRKYTQEEQTQALNIYQIQGTAAASRQTGIPKSTIDSWARKAGVRTSVTKNTREANQAQAETFRQRRYRIITELYDLAEHGIALLKNPKKYQAVAKSSFGVEVPMEFGFVPARDKQQEVTAIGIMLDKAERLEALDNDGGTREVTSMLDKLAEQIGGDLADERTNTSD
jgi:transposase-like protein